MESHIHVERIANAIMMDKNFTGHFLIVEGPKDFKVYNKFMQPQNIRIKEAFGCEKVKNVLNLLSERGFNKKIGIIDSDFMKILNTNHAISELFETDFHDVEVMICNSTALDHVVNLYCSKNKIINFERLKNSSVKDNIFELAKQIALLKLANKIHDLGLIFKPESLDGNQIKYKDFISVSDLTYAGTDKLIDTILNYTRSKNPRVKSRQEIIEKLNEVSKHVYNVNDLVNGHDLSNILFILIKKVFASTNKMVQDFNTIEDSLILAYDYEEFKKTELYKILKTYEIQNSLTILK
jgi:hypothetical protein